MSDDQKVEMIHAAIIEIMRAIEPIAKAQRNTQQNYNYRGIDDVYNACHPHFAENGVYAVSKILDDQHHMTTRQGRSGEQTIHHAIIKTRFIFLAKDGSKVETEVIGEGRDYNGDKASNKAMSIASKYAILQLLQIPTAMVDPDANPVVIPPDERAAPRAQPRGQRVTPAQITAASDLWKQWQKKRGGEVSVKAWAAFVEDTLDRMEMDVSKATEWSASDLDKVMEAIKQESANV